MRTWLAVALLVASGGVSARIVDQVDRFKGERDLRYFSEAEPRSGVPRLTLLGSIKAGRFNGNVAFFVESVSYARSRGSAWKYLNCHSVDWLVDGKPLDLGVATHDGEVKVGAVSEVIMQTLSLEQLTQLAAASKVEYRICTDEYRVSDDDLAGLRDFADRVRQASQ